MLLCAVFFFFFLLVIEMTWFVSTPDRLQNVQKSVREIFTQSEVDREIARLSIPALGALALDPLVALADTAFLGRLGALALGGVGISNNVFNLSFTCFNFLGMVTTPQIAEAFGRGDRELASRTIASALWIAFIAGMTAVIVLSAFTSPIVQFFGANTLVLPHAKSYLRARILAAPFFLSIMMGVIGAGLATAMGQITLSTGLFILMVRKGLLKLSDLRRPPELTKVLPLLKTGVILSVRTLSIMSTVSFATATAASKGSVNLAAFEIGRQIWTLFSRLLDSMSVAAQSLIPVNLGRGDYEAARQASNRVLQVGFLLGLSFSVVLTLCSGWFSTAFTADPSVVNLLRKSFPIMAYTMPINAMVFVFDGIYSGGRQFTTLAAAVTAACACAWAGLSLVKQLSLPLQAIWAALNLMMCVRALLLFIIYKSPRSPVPKRPNEIRPEYVSNAVPANGGKTTG
uniref:Protein DETOXIFICATION n=1 Tax=Rhodosorus marinus TaxID=101924 RepID=A0A7S2ZVV7_9RHOD|mmetsp:Transcript_33512/g.132197  ORF Transcript_33512/g.132197 Transcript_33512/m.132197 type:complete len:458 (+) Transcript_33512:862-2235(+)